MSNKSEAAYTEVFKFIEEKVFSLKCHSFTTDYEVAPRNALAKLYPDSIIVTCWFHFTQAVKKNASKISGFTQYLQSNADALKIYYKLQCIPLLPPENISLAFQELQNEAIAIDKKKFEPFLKYYKRQWIDKVNEIELSIITIATDHSN